MSNVNNTLPMVSEETKNPPRRLLVLVPNQSLDEPELIQRIAAMALPHHLTVLFLDVIESFKQEPAAYLRLANLSTLMTTYSIENESRLVLGGDWIREIREAWQVGDQVVCQAEQTILDQKLNRMPLSTALSIALNVPVLVMTGLYKETPARQRTRLSELRWWGIASITLIAFLGVMVWITKETSGWFNTVLLFLVFLIVMVMFWYWNNHS